MLCFVGNFLPSKELDLWVVGFIADRTYFFLASHRPGFGDSELMMHSLSSRCIFHSSFVNGASQDISCFIGYYTISAQAGMKLEFSCDTALTEANATLRKKSW